MTNPAPLPTEVTSNYPWDNTKITWDVSEERESLDLLTYAYRDAEGNDIPDGDLERGAFEVYLEYPNAQALKRAKQTKRLGRHMGNVIVVFPNDDFYQSAIYTWRNSATTGADLTPPVWETIAERCLPIPQHIGKQIHPLAFLDIWNDYVLMRDMNAQPIPLTITQDPDFQMWEARALWNAGKPHNPKDAPEPPIWGLDKGTFGDGSPVPDEHRKPFVAWMY